MGRALIAAVALAVVPAALAADWSGLDRYQHSITRHEFEQLLARIYCPSGAIMNYLTFTSNSVSIFSTTDRTNPALFTLYFADKPSSLIPHRLSFRRIALDPGHIGGEWARTEERWFQRGTDPPVQEAALNLTVVRLLQSKLEAARFTVFLTKNNFKPVTDKRPDDFRTQAERELALAGPLRGAQDEANRADAIRKRAELLFYRNAEIAARARLLNEQIKPDLTLCIHFNAVEWDECQSLVDDNRLVIFIHGNYLPAELADDDQKYRLFSKLLSRSHEKELPVAEALASALARATGLPPVEYAPGSAAIRVGHNPYVYARNLAANRLYDGPVVFLEPYYMNNRIVYERIQLGDYDGVREIAGKPYKSIFREYADAVAEALRQFLPDTPAPNR